MIRTAFLAAALLAITPALAASSTAAPPAAGQSDPHAAMTMQTPRLDVNSATVDQLAAIKGLNRSYAEAIVKGRPYKSEEELAKRGVLPEPVFKEARGALTVKHN